MTEAFCLEPGADGGWVLPALSPRVGAEVLHHGPMLVATEQSALEAVHAATGAALPRCARGRCGSCGAGASHRSRDRRSR